MRREPLTVIIPTFNEAGNVAELVSRIGRAAETDPRLSGVSLDVLFVDDSTDDTAAQVDAAAAVSVLDVRVIRREERSGGLGGAVLVGVRTAQTEICLVMDGDLQHPPEEIGALYERLAQGDADIVSASRYLRRGDAGGLVTVARHGVSRLSTVITQAMFPVRLRGATDPMTGFFIFDRRTVRLDRLKPQGFKILLEMLVREDLVLAEVPFDFGVRHAGRSKATLRQGVHFARQLLQLRFGRMSGFVAIGLVGAVVNVGIVWALTALGVGTFAATLVGAEVTIVGNFLAQDRLVFHDLRTEARGFWGRFFHSFLFNNIEGFVRIGLVVWLVNRGVMSAAAATAILLVVAFLLRYVFHSLVVYAPRKPNSRRSSGRE